MNGQIIYKNKWDKLSIIITTITVILIVVGIVLSLYYKNTEAQIALLIVTIALLVAYLMRPTQTLFEGDDIVIVRPIGKKVIHAHQYSITKLTGLDTVFSMRLFASGGIFGYMGLWRLKINEPPKWRNVYSYLTDSGKDILLLQHQETKKKYLINAPTEWAILHTSPLVTP